MSKEARKRSLAENEARAVTCSIRISPRKLNDVAAGIRGMKVDKALAHLTFSRRRIAGTIKKTLESAIANAENNHDLDINQLVVAEAHVGKNLVMKRWTPRARGRVGRIEKFFSQLTIIVREARERETVDLDCLRLRLLDGRLEPPRRVVVEVARLAADARRLRMVAVELGAHGDPALPRRPRVVQRADFGVQGRDTAAPIEQR